MDSLGCLGYPWMPPGIAQQLNSIKQFEAGHLVQPIDFSIEGLGFYAVNDNRHPRKDEIEILVEAISDSYRHGWANG